MSLATHTIEEIGGDTKTLEQWGITGGTVTTRDDARDTLSLVATRSPAAGPIWPMNATLVLRDHNDVRRFRGTVGLPAVSASKGRFSHVYTVASPTWYFDRLIYRQQWPFPVDPEAPLGAKTNEYVSQVILHREVSEGVARKVNVRDQVGAILGYAAAAAVPFEYQTAGIPTVEPPEDEQLDLRISDALDSTLAWCPEVQRHFYYGGTVPRLIFTRATFDLSDGSMGPGVWPAHFGTHAINLTDLEDFSFQGRDDLLVPNMRVTYIVTNSAVPSEGADPIVWRTVHRDNSVAMGGGWGTMESTVQLRGLIWDGSTFTEPEPVPPDGLAESLHAGFGRLLYELSFSRTTDSLLWDLYPGEVWNISGAEAGLTTAYSVCKDITRDLRTGKVDVHCGLGSTLGLSGRLQLLRPNRKRKVPEHAGEQNYGFGEDDKKNKDVNADGQEQTFKVVFNGVKTPFIFKARPA